MEGLVDETSKPVCEYESPKLMRNLRAHGSGSATLELEAAALVDDVRVEVLRVVDVGGVEITAEEDVLVLVGPALLLATPGMHWA